LARRTPDQKIVVAVVFVCGMLMSSIDSTVVNVALATLSRQFNVRPSAIDAVVVGYLVSLAVVIPASGWLGDRFGTKRIYLLALALFTAASALCGLAGSFSQLVIFRVLQGAGGGMLTPVGTAMLYRTFPPNERVQVSRILIFPRILGPAGGPVLGGLLVSQLSWRWIFYVNVPVGIIAFLFGIAFLHEHREPAAGDFDLPGFVLAGTGFPLVMYALSEGPSRGWASLGIIASALGGFALIAAFVTVELRVRQPMVHLRLMGDRLFNTTNLPYSVTYLPSRRAPRRCVASALLYTTGDSACTPSPISRTPPGSPATTTRCRRLSGCRSAPCDGRAAAAPSSVSEAAAPVGRVPTRHR